VLPIPGYLIPYILIGTVAIVTTVLLGLHRALKRAGWPDQDRKRAFQSVAALLVGWYLATLLLAWLEFYRGASTRIPTIQYGLLIPIIVGVALAWKWKLLGRVIDAVPQEWIVGVQLYRAMGLIFLVLLAVGRLPGLFAWPAGVGDIIVGVLAPFVGLAYARNPRSATGLVRIWNWLGIVDLVVAIGTGFLTSPSPLQMLSFDAPNELISAFPLVMVPVFLVPLSILLHLASLKKLGQTKQERKVPSL
jgi:hypothetical protein